MEEIFETKKKFKQVMIESSIIDKLNQLDKGSPNKAIKHLLNINPDNQTAQKVQQNESDISEIQDKLERVVQRNNLRT